MRFQVHQHRAVAMPSRQRELIHPEDVGRPCGSCRRPPQQAHQRIATGSQAGARGEHGPTLPAGDTAVLQECGFGIGGVVGIATEHQAEVLGEGAAGARLVLAAETADDQVHADAAPRPGQVSRIAR
jgi:hypothetical protein